MTACKCSVFCVLGSTLDTAQASVMEAFEEVRTSSM